MTTCSTTGARAVTNTPLQRVLHGAPLAECLSADFKKLGDVRGHALKPFKGPKTIRFAHGMKGAVHCGSRQRSNTRRSRALGLNYFGIQSVVAQAAMFNATSTQGGAV